jgi:hypothetical protein
MKYLIICFQQSITGMKSLSFFASKTSKSIIRSTSSITVVKVFMWFLGWLLFTHVEFGSLWIIISLFGVIFFNLGKRKEGDLSAYSVFNDGFQQLLGTMNAEQFDNEIRNRGTVEELQEDNDDQKEQPARPVAGHVKDFVKKRGKKARRTYEDRLKRREAMQQHMDEAFGINGGEAGEAQQDELWEEWGQEGDNEGPDEIDIDNEN